MIDNWSKVTISKYKEIKAVIDNGGSEVEMNVELLSVLTDLETDELLDMPLVRFNNLLQGTGFLYEEMPKRMVSTRYVLGGVVFDVMLNIEQMTAAQFIDYQTYIKESEKYLVELLSIFLIPKGHKYCDGYDVVEMQKVISDNLCIVDAGALTFFFSEWYKSLLKATIHCLTKKMKKLMKKEKNREMVEKMKEAIAHLERSGDGLALLTEWQQQ